MDRQVGWRPVQERSIQTGNEVLLLLSHIRVLMLIIKTGYGSLIRTYVAFILSKLRFHRLRPEFNGLFEYEEYISLKGIDDPNEGYVFESCDWVSVMNSLVA